MSPADSTSPEPLQFGAPGGDPAPSEAAALCRALLDGTRDDALVADGEGVITFISQGLARAAGEDPARLAGQPADRALSVMELPTFAELSAMLSSVSSARTEAHMRDADGRTRTVLLRGVSTSAGPGEERYVWLVTPLSRVRTVERANRFLRSELETKSRVLALVSHELRTPLNVMLSQLSMLEAELRGPLDPEQRDCVDRSLRAGRSLLSLINDLIDFAKLQSEDPQLELEACPPEQLVREALDTAGSLVEDEDLDFTVENRSPGARATADLDRTRQILHKLLANAVKYSDSGTIRVTIDEVELPEGPQAAKHVRDRPAPDGGRDGDGAVGAPGPGYVGVDVCDTGTGLPRSEVERVFEPFEQVADVLSRKEEGSGLGLAIARRLAQLQGGELLVHRASSEGAVFRLYLPREA